MRFKLDSVLGFKLYTKPKITGFKNGGFIVSVGNFKLHKTSPSHDKKIVVVELEMFLTKLYKFIKTDMADNRETWFFYMSYFDFRNEWEEIALNVIMKEAGYYQWLICNNDPFDNDCWTINICDLHIYHPWVQEEILSTSRLLNETFDIEALRLVEKIMRHISEIDGVNRLDFKFSKDEELMMEAEGIYKYKYRIGDLFYEKIPESGSISSIPERVGISGENSLVKDGFFDRMTNVREQIKEYFSLPYESPTVSKYVDETEPTKYEEKPKGFLGKLIDLLK
jgi:hypothetical protein|nr:MAG TPA: hypothetical protein [Caudoviricetes sp.]